MDKFNSNKTPYGFCKVYGDHSYGHMEIIINNAIGDDYWRKPRIRVSCQVGGGSDSSPDQFEKPYAWHHGVEANCDHMSLQDLELSVKFMRAFEKKLAKMNDELGSPETFAEYCARILIASGVDPVFINRQWGGGYRELTDLPTRYLSHRSERGDLRKDLIDLEAMLCKRYTRRAA